MKLFLITFGALVLVILAMAVGVIFSNRKLQGSCGGLGKLMGDECEFCDSKHECQREKNKKPAPSKSFS